MTEMRVIVPAELEEWINARVAEGRHVDASDYIRDLIRRDQEGMVPEPQDTPEYVAWVREKVAEARNSPILQQDPREVIDAIIARRHARSG